MRWTIAALAAVLWFCCPVALGEEAQSGEYDLSRVQHMEEFAGPKAAQELLARQGFVVTDPSFKQIFEAYIGSPFPKFITTDSAWHTYHVLLEEGVRQLEESQAEAMEAFSRGLLKAALEKVPGGQGPYGDLATYAAVGLALQDERALDGLPPAVGKPAAALAKELQTGAGLVNVPFLGLPLDSQRFRACSFYAESATLRGYFAARQWYTLCDFRAKSLEETILAVRLALLVDGTPELKQSWLRLTDPYDELLGVVEDGDVRKYVKITRKALGDAPGESAIDGGIGPLREKIAAQLPLPMINDQLLQPDQYMDKDGKIIFPEETKGFRLLPARRLPCAVLFQNTIDPLVKGRMFPSGLDFLAVGPLASDAGKRALRGAVQDEESLRAILTAEAGPLPKSLHGQALETLRLLQEPLPESAPAPLRTDAWQDKQAWTQLGAWAEQRHTWALHTKLTVTSLGATIELPGMVSPYPDFFTALGKLSRATAAALTRYPNARPIDTKAAGKKLEQIIATAKERTRPGRRFEDRDEAAMMEFESFVESYFAGNIPESRDAFMKRITGLEPLVKKCAEGAALMEDELKVLAKVQGQVENVPALMGQFADLCDSLSSIATKELAHQELSKGDVQLVKDYGVTLARFHFYGGNSWLEPRDDFPMVAPIFASPITDQVLYAGLSRPEALYVIVETKSGPVLHLGAVLSYREFRRPAGEPVDDAAWRKEVQAGKAPAPPEFTQSFRAGGK